MIFLKMNSEEASLKAMKKSGNPAKSAMARLFWKYRGKVERKWLGLRLKQRRRLLNEIGMTGWKACPTERNMKRNYYSLIEMLVVIAIMLVMFEIAFQFFYDGSKLCTQAVEKSLNNQEMFILSGKFRNIIHLSPNWKKEGNCLVAGQKKLMAENNRIS